MMETVEVGRGGVGSHEVPGPQGGVRLALQ